MSRVLIIEEQGKIRRSLMDGLKKEGFEVCDGIRWEKAGDLLEKNTYDLIIVDLYVKSVDGYEIMKAIKFLNSSAEVIAIIPKDGYDTDQVTRCGIYDYILKPFQQKDLVEMGKKALEKKQLADKVRNLERFMNMDG
ncbi:MAG: response regulator [wastewater metagenome]|nr:response regulator [Candidatus Loosdrechtia aerotolerans]